MSHTSGLLIPIFAGAAMVYCAAVSAQEAPKARFTPRELFYMAVPEKGAKKTPPKPTPTPPATSTPTTQAQASRPTGSRTPASTRTPTGAPVIPAVDVQTAPAPSSGPAAGLRYTILKNEGGRMVEVPPDTVFHARDGIQLRVQSNTDGYLYVVNRGSSGTWKPMFPAPEIAGGNNRVDGFQEYTLPRFDHNMVFDSNPGTENLFIVFSRQPVGDFEELIYSLQDKARPAPRPASQPAAPPPARDKQMLVAANINIADATIGHLRNTYSRDLIIEKVNADTPGPRKETAVYVVNPTGSSDSRVVADLKLVHQ